MGHMAQMPGSREVARRARLEHSKVKRFLDCGLHLVPQNRFRLRDESDTDPEQIELNEVASTSPEAQRYGGDPSVLAFTDSQEAIIARVWRVLDKTQQQVLSLRYDMDEPPKAAITISRRLGLPLEEVERIEGEAIVRVREMLEENAPIDET